MSSRMASIRSLILGISSLPRVSVPPVPNDAVFPYVTVDSITGKDLESLTGLSGLTRELLQVSVWSADYEEAFAKRELIRALIGPYAGTVLGNTIQAVNHAGDRQLRDSTRDLWQLVYTAFIWWG